MFFYKYLIKFIGKILVEALIFCAERRLNGFYLKNFENIVILIINKINISICNWKIWRERNFKNICQFFFS